MPSLHLILALSLAAAAAGPARAQTPEPPSEAEPRAPVEEPETSKPVETLDKVEVRSGPRSDEDLRRQSTAAKIVFSREELTRYGDTQVTDVLKRLPGVSMQGGSVRMRGLGAGFTLILINGEPAPAGFSLDNLSPSQIERIELSRGPSAENSAQAVAGSINIILKEPPRTRQLDWRGGVNMAQGQARPWVNLTLGNREGDFSYTLPASVYRNRFESLSRVFTRSKDAQGQALVQTVANQDDGRGQGFSASPRLAWRLGDRNDLSWQSFINRHDWRNRGSNDFLVSQGLGPLSQHERYTGGGRWQMLRSNLQWTRGLEDEGSLELRLGGQAWSRRAQGELEGRDRQDRPVLSQRSEGDSGEQTATLNVKYKRPLWEAHSLVLGLEAESKRRHERRSQLDNDVEQLPGYEGEFRSTIQRAAAFVQDDWDISPQWSASMGLRAEGIDTVALSTDAGMPQSRHRSRVVTPLLHLAYKPKATRDVLRASLTRSYRAPNLNQLLPRPSVSSQLYPVSGPNVQSSPDRVGNPALKPELALGLDLAYETYLKTGGVLSVSAFHRQVNGLIRSTPQLQSVAWAAVPRWVAMPTNFARAHTSGLEMEAKGRAAELWPEAFDAQLPLDVRASLSLYRSSVSGVPGPDNRLESQQPYALNLGFDYKLSRLPLSWGSSLAYAPAYAVQLSTEQRNTLSQSSKIDAYAQWRFTPKISMRVSVRDLAPLTEFSSSSFSPEAPLSETLLSQTERKLVRSLGVQLEVKL